MIRPELLAMICCPQTRQRLEPADEALLERLWAAAAAGALRNQAGERVEQKIQGGLIRADGAVLYPVVDDIPVLLADECIALDQLPA